MESKESIYKILKDNNPMVNSDIKEYLKKYINELESIKRECYDIITSSNGKDSIYTPLIIHKRASYILTDIQRVKIKRNSKIDDIL